MITQIGSVADALNGRLGVALRFLPTGESLFFHADAEFPTASVIKVAIVAELFTQASEKRLSLDTPIAVADEDMTPGSGVLTLLSPGVTLPLRDLAMLAIAVSDNTASNLCLRAVGGPDAVNERMHGAWNMTGTTIHRPIRFHLRPSDPTHTATGTPRDMLQLLTLLEAGQIGGRDVSDRVLRLLGEVQDTAMLPRYLSVNPYAAALNVPLPPLTVRHKTGGVTGTRNDAGLITRHGENGRRETLAICVYTKDVRDDRWTAANAGVEAVAQVSKIACDYFFKPEQETKA